MTKCELIAKVAQVSDLTKAHAERVVEAILGTIKEGLSGGDKVTLRGFGTFKVEQRAARVGRNPKIGTEITIPAKNVVKFKPSTELKDWVN
ncbi:HU family DNA-binding protein [Pseudodesulfovibrio indicus]|uniref:DNA-binding protein n=1 Tax=Pseudodesulfovibrio indicus TaxID=1716143 RepID=A0A126QLN2_9BACT|nr:HU family DNA-binding protein [Pseudodesulfovibrio indicus]AMK10882.1 DNA-binding protein [Pseudodesulfovibrio indicus]TDT91874.1 DNA-binding protein HU-beta [Pseudodesulfovibrio indicus]